MSIIPKQIGWSNESNLLWDILKKIERLTQVTSTSGGGGGGGTGDVSGPAFSTNSSLVEFSGITGKIIKDGGVVVSAFVKTALNDATAVDFRTTIGAQSSLGFTPENVANKVSVVAASATQYPNNDAIIAYSEKLANKATDFSVINNTLYPTTQATNTQIETFFNMGLVYTTSLNYNLI